MAWINPLIHKIRFNLKKYKIIGSTKNLLKLPTRRNIKIGYTALMFAAENGNLEIAKLLQESASNYAVLTCTQNILLDAQSRITGDTAAMLAVKNKHFKICQYLIRQHTNVKLENFKGESLEKLLTTAANKKLLNTCALNWTNSEKYKIIFLDWKLM